MRNNLAEIYLDHASTTPPLPVALQAFNEAIEDSFGNPSSAHAFGQEAREVLEEARARIAKCIGAEPEEIYFTSGATEAAKLAISSFEYAGYTVLSSRLEHHAVSENCDYRSIHAVGAPSAAAVMLVNNETGEIPSKPKTGAWICDATSALGHIPVDVERLGCSHLFGGSHKFGGIPGAGFLFARKGAPLSPIFRGGGQERGARAGTESVALVAAMASALEWQCENMMRNLIHVSMGLHPFMIQSLEGLGVEFLINAKLENGTANASPYILNLSFPGVEGSALVLLLSKMGVMVSAGAACTTGDNAPSHVLMAMYGDEARARSAIRISFSHENTVEEIEAAAERIAEAVRTLRGISAGATS